MEKEISIILPVYKGENYLEKNLNIIYSYLDKELKDKYEIILVIDKYNERYNFLEKYKRDNLIIIKNKKRYGKGFAIKLGFIKANGKYIGFLDSDLSVNIDEFVKLYNILKKNKKYDIIIGSKYINGSYIRYSNYRYLFSISYQILRIILFPQLYYIKDTQVGCKIFKKEVAKFIIKKQKINGFSFDVELLLIANKYKYKILEYPIKINLDEDNTTISSNFLSLIKTISKMFSELMAIFVNYYIFRKY